MQKTDLGLLVLALVALLVTAIAFAGSSRWTSEHTVTFASAESDLVAQGPSDAEGAGAHFTWLVPDNATSATVQVAVAFSGQAVQGGSATVTVRVKMPDGTYTNDTISAMPIPQGSAAPASLLVDVSAAWSHMPDSVRDAGAGKPTPEVWTMPLDVWVVVSQPSDVPVASYTFTATAVGSVSSYHAE